MNFIIYNINGEIIRTGSCSQTDFKKQAGDNEFIIEGIANDEINIIVNNNIADKPPRVITYDVNFENTKKSTLISEKCSKLITSGFYSNALGSSFMYPSNNIDQVNLSCTIQKSLLPSAQPTDYYPILCADASNVWDYRLHTAAQIQQVGSDSYSFILAARQKNASLQAQIQAATNQAELDAITW